MKTNRRKRWPWLIGGALLTLGTGFQLQRWCYESPTYEVVARNEGFELRRYAPRVVAETTVQAGSRREATREGFRRLAGYIFGGNLKVAITTPVEAAPQSQRISMTTPVESVPGDDGWVITFTMPFEYALEDLPRPNDTRVVLRERPGELVAALRFTGRMRQRDIDARRAQLLAALERAGYRAETNVGTADYDPPTTVFPWLRRNEVYARVSSP